MPADSGMPFPFAELYGSANSNNRPRIIRGVAISSWKPNDRAMRCGVCVKKFGFLRRRHHCRACGDVCCRRCLGFCLVDVPLTGVDISFTCIKCIRQHNSQPSLVEDFAALARSADNNNTVNNILKSSKYESKLVRTTRFNTTANNASFLACSPTFTAFPNTPASPAPDSALTPCSSPHTADYRVIISQYHNQKLHSVCSLLSDYLECKGSAIVLMHETHVWVIAHRGLRSSAMQSANFLSLCHHAMKSKEAFTASRGRKKVPDDQHETFRFFGAAPIFHKHQQFTPVGCVVALDTKLRNESTCKRVKKTLENLARLVMNVLADEEHLMRLYASGEFKVFASSSNAMDNRPTMSTTASSDHFGLVSPIASPNSATSSPLGASLGSLEGLNRSHSFVFGDTAGFFARYAADSNALRKYAHSDPEPKRTRTRPPPPPIPHHPNTSSQAISNAA